MRLFTTAAAIALLAAPTLLLAGPVDVNTADAETISAELKGIGMTKAKAIVEYREKHGPFRTADDLTLVKGIGELKLLVSSRRRLPPGDLDALAAFDRDLLLLENGQNLVVDMHPLPHPGKGKKVFLAEAALLAPGSQLFQGIVVAVPYVEQG